MKKLVYALALVLAVSACESDEQKAAKHFEAAKEFVEQGDIPRALVELRNTLQNDETLRDARMMFAELLQEQGRLPAAFGQYRYIVEKNPEDGAAARAMSLIAFDAMGWDDAKRYTGMALAQMPEDPELQAVKAGLDYRDGLLEKDQDLQDSAIATARKLLADDAERLRARRILIAAAVESNDLNAALPLIDEGLKFNPNDRDLNNVRLVVLGRLNDKPEIEAQILSMVSLYPDDEEIGRLLVQFYLQAGRIDEAEAWLRGRIDPTKKNPEARMVLLRFLAEVRSSDALRAELEDLLSQDPLPVDVAANPLRFRALKAGADFNAGETDAAMAQLEALIVEAETPTAEIDTIKVQLAQMRLSTNNQVGARALVEEVLEHDAGNPGALKMKAGWLIDEDETQQAIRLLRDALAGAPDDADVMTLLARAYQRDGRPELMADMLARAVEVSNQAPGESLRYATYLAQKQEFTSAETVLIDALRRQPKNLDLLALLTRVHLSMQDWGRAQQDIRTIRERFDTPQGTALADEFQAQMLVGQGRIEDLGGFLDELAAKSGDALAPKIAVIRNAVRTGQLEQALSQAERLSEENPDSDAVTLLLSQIQMAAGQVDEAKAGIEGILAKDQKNAAAWNALYGLNLRQGDEVAAAEVLDRGIEQLPKNLQLNAIKAGMLEHQGDIDGAIEIYAWLYEMNSDDVIIANNYASLLSSTRDDQASLDIAWTAARRLNGSNVPAFQDTFGWIAFRRGDATQALQALAPAAQGLPGDPAVAYHHARALAALNHVEEARMEYDRAEALIEQGARGYPGLSDEIAKAKAELTPN